MVELVDTRDLKSRGPRAVRVQVPLLALLSSDRQLKPPNLGGFYFWYCIEKGLYINVFT